MNKEQIEDFEIEKWCSDNGFSSIYVGNQFSVSRTVDDILRTRHPTLDGFPEKREQLHRFAKMLKDRKI